MRMLDGFNESWIEFQESGSKAIKGRTNAVAVVAALVANTNRAATLLLKSLWQPRRFQDPVRCVNHFRVPGDAELSPGRRAVPNFMGARRFWRCGGNVN